MRTPLKTKILSLPILAAVFLAVVGSVAVGGLLRLDEINSQTTLLTRALSHHQSADMMHDAIRGDVLALQLATDSAGMEAAHKELKDHCSEFEQQIDALHALNLPQDTRTTLEQAEPFEREYIRSAKDIFALAATDKPKAMTRLGDYNALFEKVEDRLATVTSAVEGSLKAIMSEQDRAFHTLMNTIIAVTVVCLVIMFTVAIIVSGRLARSIQAIKQVIDAMAGGDWTQEAAIRSGDEIEDMAQALSRMSGAVRTVLHEVGSKARDIEHSAAKLTSTSASMGTDANTTADQAATASASAEQVSTGIATVASAATELGHSIQEIAGQTNEAAVIASEAVRTANEVGTTIARLGDSSRLIGDVVNTINTIAGQTNLLALNASIEAASAGPAGKGFAVVAGEVKSLAKQTADATQDIAARVAAIQSDVAECTDAIKRIGGIIERINHGTQTIASAVEEQTATTGEIGRTAQEAAQGSSQIATAIESVAKTAEETTGKTKEITLSARDLQQVAQSLQQLILTLKH